MVNDVKFLSTARNVRVYGSIAGTSEFKWICKRVDEVIEPGRNRQYQESEQVKEKKRIVIKVMGFKLLEEVRVLTDGFFLWLRDKVRRKRGNDGKVNEASWYNPKTGIYFYK